MPITTNTTLPGNPHCAEVWANAHDHQAKINYWIPGLRMEIQGIKDNVEADSPAAARCDVAQQIVTQIETENNKPLTKQGTAPPMPSK